MKLKLKKMRRRQIEKIEKTLGFSKKVHAFRIYFWVHSIWITRISHQQYGTIWNVESWMKNQKKIKLLFIADIQIFFFNQKLNILYCMLKSKVKIHQQIAHKIIRFSLSILAFFCAFIFHWTIFICKTKNNFRFKISRANITFFCRKKLILSYQKYIYNKVVWGLRQVARSGNDLLTLARISHVVVIAKFIFRFKIFSLFFKPPQPLLPFALISRKWVAKIENCLCFGFIINLKIINFHSNTYFQK